jgi:hypothetical protein
MNDAEWESWRTSWVDAEGPLPDVAARAAREAWRHRRANLALFGLMSAGCLVDAWAAIVRKADPITCWSLVVWGVTVSIAFAWIQRGILFRKTASPHEALEFLEQRVRVERRGAQVFRWAYAVGIVFVAIYFRNLFGDDWVVKLVARLVLLAVFAITFSVPWWVRRAANRRQKEIDGWRRWLAEQQLF